MLSEKGLGICKKIGYEAQYIVCVAEVDCPIADVKETADNICKRIKLLSVEDLEKLKAENGISLIEYGDMIKDASTSYKGDHMTLKNRAQALLQMMVDLTYSKLQNDAFYKRMAEVNETDV